MPLNERCLSGGRAKPRRSLIALQRVKCCGRATGSVLKSMEYVCGNKTNKTKKKLKRGAGECIGGGEVGGFKTLACGNKNNPAESQRLPLPTRTLLNVKRQSL